MVDGKTYGYVRFIGQIRAPRQMCCSTAGRPPPSTFVFPLPTSVARAQSVTIPNDKTGAAAAVGGGMTAAVPHRMNYNDDADVEV